MNLRPRPDRGDGDDDDDAEDDEEEEDGPAAGATLEAPWHRNSEIRQTTSL